MAPRYVLPLNDSQATLDNVGGKGASLARLTNAGLPVPGGFHVTTGAYRAFVVANGLQPRILAALRGADPADPSALEAASTRIRQHFAAACVPDEIASAIRSAYAELVDAPSAIGEPRSSVAVRSSATAEDLPEASFAGQQETYLNVSGADSVLAATVKCWASLWTARAIGYRSRQGIAPDEVALAVVVQLLVPAEAAGILFTANPVNGRRDQVMISAAWGLGEAVVGGMVTPDSLTVDKATGNVLERLTADKQVMTVRAAGGTHEKPAPEVLRRAPVLSDQAAAELTGLAVRIEKLYGAPMDIEWALAGGKFAILQARPVTALPDQPAPGEPAAAAPVVAWPRPNPKAWYARSSLCEHLPNPVSPLFGTLGIRLANQATDELMRGMTDSPIEYSYQVLNGYVYWGAMLGLREIWIYVKMTVGLLGTVIRTGTKRWQSGRVHLADTVARWEDKPVEALSPSVLLAGACELFLESARFYTVIQAGTLPAATTSETTFNQVYKLMKGKEGPEATVFLFGLDTTPLNAEKSLYDLAAWVRASPPLTAYVLSTASDRLAADLRADPSPGGIAGDDWTEWRARCRGHLERYGRTAYEFDFVNPTPIEAPEPLLDAVKMYLEGQGSNPYERQRAAAARREQATAEVLGRVGWPRKNLFRRVLNWAQKVGPAREDSLADLGMAHPAIRRLLGELGRRFAAEAAIETAEDIYWLEEREIEELVTALQRGDALPDCRERVPPRKAAWHTQQQLVPPAMLPEKSRFSKILPWSEQRQEGRTVLKGVGASGGQVTATACVLLGPEDFGQMRAGDVMVAVTTTPAWTPLFTMASAVVTDIGGPLSHSSIVAREYGIPAVMATGVATRRIHSGQTITVDGAAGTVTLENNK
jgi:rifampicin phosphotransferase